jgi:hypothetical protein
VLLLRPVEEELKPLRPLLMPLKPLLDMPLKPLLDMPLKPELLVPVKPELIEDTEVPVRLLELYELDVADLVCPQDSSPYPTKKINAMVIDLNLMISTPTNP